MTLEERPSEVALIDRGDNLVVMGRKMYDKLYVHMHGMQAEIERLNASLVEAEKMNAHLRDDALTYLRKEVRDVRVLRATVEGAEGFRVHLVEEDWDHLVEVLGGGAK